MADGNARIARPKEYTRACVHARVYRKMRSATKRGREKESLLRIFAERRLMRGRKRERKEFSLSKCVEWSRCREKERGGDEREDLNKCFTNV